MALLSRQEGIDCRKYILIENPSWTWLDYSGDVDSMSARVNAAKPSGSLEERQAEQS